MRGRRRIGAGASAPVFVFTEPSVESYGTIGRLYRDTLRAMGLRVAIAPYPDRPPELPAGSVVLHATLGYRLTPWAGVRNIAVPFHEWTRYPPAWAARLDAFDDVWAATPFLASVLRRSGVSRPIDVVPPALDLQPPLPKTSWTAGRPFRFLFVGEPHFRKGHHLLIEGFRRLRLGPERAVLTLKTSPSCAWRSTDPGIRVIAARWPAARMRRVYAAHDAFVSASLGEGLGLGVAEAMLAGLPVAATKWSGHAALVTPGGYLRIPHRVVPQPYCSRPDFFTPGQACGLASVDAVADAMAALLRMGPRSRAAQARLASAAIRRRFGFEICSRRLHAALAAGHEVASDEDVADAMESVA